LWKIFPQLQNAYSDFLEIVKKSSPGKPDYDAAVARLATLCDQYGWKPEAEAWRKIIAGG
jgi:hypothetical protein